MIVTLDTDKKILTYYGKELTLNNLKDELNHLGEGAMFFLEEWVIRNIPRPLKDTLEELELKING